MLVVPLLLLLACAPPSAVPSPVAHDGRVQLFTQFFPEARYHEAKVSSALADVVAEECPAARGHEVLRVTYTAPPAATLVVYATEDRVLCVIPKAEGLRFRQGDPATVPPGTLFTVNGEPITQAQLDASLRQLPPSLRPSRVGDELAQGSAAAQLINAVLLRQASAAMNVSATDVEAARRSLGLASRERHAVRAALQLQRFLAREGIDIPVADLLRPEEVRFRQIFIARNAGAAQRLRELLIALRQGEDFCTLVREWSDDVASRERCGEYRVARGVIDPALEAALFALQENQTTVVESDRGYHLFFLLGRLPRSTVRVPLSDPAAQERLALLLFALRARADIIAYS